MRRSSIALALAASACFAEVPEPPSDAATGDATATTSTASTPTTTDPTTEPTTTASTTTAQPDDADTDSNSDATTTSELPNEGLFACEEKVLVCPAWQCDDCTEADAAGLCVLESMRQQANIMLEVRQCTDECKTHRILPRGGGQDEVQWQWRGQDLDFADLMRCRIQPPEFFAACQETFTEPCANPQAWFAECDVTDESSC